jgi:hypothetical protein
MQYAIFCYHAENVVCAWTKEEDAAVMGRLAQVHENVGKRSKLGPIARLMPTTTATTVRNQQPALVVDGPFAETKEQLLGFYVVECRDLEEVVGIARELGAANPGGCYEIRPISLYMPGAVTS